MNLLTINKKLLRYKNKLVMRGSSSPVLSTVENISVNNNILTFDPVKNATNYEVFVDGVSIGTYEVSTGETWVLNSDISSADDIMAPNLSFISNSQNFTSINAVTGKGGCNLAYDQTAVFIISWTNEAYRTITFDSPVTDTALLTWLQANGVKQ